MTEASDHTLAWMRRLDAKVGRLLAVLEDLTVQPQRVEGPLASFAVIETFDREVTRIDNKLDERGRRLTRADATVLAEPPG